MNRYTLGLTAAFVSFGLHANPHISSPDVVYGTDNRVDTFESSSPLFVKLAESTAAMVKKEHIVYRGELAELHAPALMETIPPRMMYPVCKDQRFAEQPTAGECSGFLVAEDILVTAGHCVVSPAVCEQVKWIFNYKVDDVAQSSVSVGAQDVYGCTSIIKRGLSFGVDFALVKLDRPVKGKALKIATNQPEVGTSVVMIGHPTGLPQKISDGARIVAIEGDNFRTDLDAFRGNSGSAVFNANTGEIIGILVNGKTDYVDNHLRGCSEVNVLPHEEAGEGVSSFRQFLPFLE